MNCLTAFLDKMVEWFNGLYCFFTGGCEFSDTLLECTRDENAAVFKLRNRCLKCGQVHEWEVPVESILPHLNERDRAYRLYICDKKRCTSCNNPDCHYTTDVTHAKNFSYDGVAKVWYEDPNKREAEVSE